jgi:hypothetical protein
MRRHIFETNHDRTHARGGASRQSLRRRSLVSQYALIPSSRRDLRQTIVKKIFSLAELGAQDV